MKIFSFLLIIFIVLFSCDSNSFKIKSNFTENQIAYLSSEYNLLYSNIANHYKDSFKNYFEYEAEFYEYFFDTLLNNENVNKEIFKIKYNTMIENIPIEIDEVIINNTGSKDLDYKRLINFNLILLLLTIEDINLNKITDTPMASIFHNVNIKTINKMKKLFDIEDINNISKYKDHNDKALKSQDMLNRTTKNNSTLNYPMDVKKNFGTVCITNIIENNIAIRNYPSLDSKIIHKAQKDDIIWILGFSGEKEIIENIEGNWLHVIFQDNRDIVGWIFSKYVNINDKEYSPINFIEIIPETNKKNSLIKISYIIDDKEIFIEKGYDHWKNNYLIVWGQYEHGFHYTNKPGIYLINNETFELRHITYLGSFERWPHAYTVFTDDFEYLIQDSGTSSGVRGITAWRLSDKEEVFSGSYYGFNVNGHTIEIAYTYDDWHIERGYLDEEIIAYGKKYREENNVPQDLMELSRGDDFHVYLVIQCSYNLTTGERKILDGIYIYRQ